MRYVDNPPNPWLSYTVEWLGEPPEAKVEVFEETATRTIITRNNSPAVGFDYSVNCYRGCAHACSSCFSRPTHEYPGCGADRRGKALGSDALDARPAARRTERAGR